MESKLLHTADGQWTFSVVLQSGDDVMACLMAFAQREHLSAAQFTAIGAFSRAVLGYFRLGAEGLSAHGD
jgi:predicted DNA-binding protein with PD1-like motif